ncbi:MAG: DEAD/DEAH box helicase family protein [Oscillospiraceae bacterium]|nr:DEAD/DEAH box helicase family protein [Oscillospiraceae bacterium]
MPNLQDLKLNKSYVSYGDDTIAESLIKPSLKVAKWYRRSAGFFSSTVIAVILDGIVSLVRNGGKIQLITSQRLSDVDIEAIRFGYEKRHNIIENSFVFAFEEEAEKLDDSNLDILSELVSSGVMDVKVAVTKGLGIYHDKFGIIEDSGGNSLAFFGSSNDTANGYVQNYEKVRIARSWVDNESATVDDEVNEFDSLWNNTNQFVDIYDFKEALEKCILQAISRRKATRAQKPIVLRNYQEDAINAWEENGYKGFFVMATGTGKTWTAIYAAEKLQQHEKTIVVICVPYKHLVQQWYEDVKKVFSEARIIKVSSENAAWEKEIKEEVIRSRHYPDNRIVIISTIMSFNKERFEDVLSTSSRKRLLIVDEAHRFVARPDWLLTKYDYLLGLSATPYTGINTALGDELMDWFGGSVYNLPIEFAINNGYLIPYSYYPIYVNATKQEEDDFTSIVGRIAACFNARGILVNFDEFIKLRRRQLRIISMAEEKIMLIDSILDEVLERDHFICYCGDGRLFDDEGNELRHIQFVKRHLDAHGYRPAQFTATENMVKRMDIIDRFNSGEVTALAAIRCLDEGVNIPSIKSALILSSNDSLREFVQRRGRILRKHSGKESAKIYDVIVLPSSATPRIALLEFRRFYEYARLSTNADELLEDMKTKLSAYEITFEQIIGEISPDVEELDE